MAITYTITPNDGGTGITLTNTATGYTLTGGHTLTLVVTGTINGLIATYVLSGTQVTAFEAKTPIVLTASELTAAEYLLLPDDYFETQLTDKDAGAAIIEQSAIMPFSCYSYVQKIIHDKIVHTERLVGLLERTRLHEQFIQLQALVILGVNPIVSMKNTVVARINYLKTL